MQFPKTTTFSFTIGEFTKDFEDGELKTNKCDRYGRSLETMFITQESEQITSTFGAFRHMH